MHVQAQTLFVLSQNMFDVLLTLQRYITKHPDIITYWMYMTNVDQPYYNTSNLRMNS